MRPYSAYRVTNYGVYHNYDYALGFIAGWGAHPLDAAQWGLNADDTSPVRYEGIGSMPPPGYLYNTTRYWDTISHLSDSVVRSGKPAEWDPKKEKLVGGTDLQQALLHRQPRENWNFFL